MEDILKKLRPEPFRQGALGGDVLKHERECYDEDQYLAFGFVLYAHRLSLFLPYRLCPGNL